MPRPRGSKNKSKIQVEKPLPIAEAKGEKICQCGHRQGEHYGPKDRPEINWCNHSGCPCQVFK